MTYKQLSINEKINVKSWMEHNVNGELSKYGAKVNILQYVLIYCNDVDLIGRKHLDYPCTKETRLFRDHWRNTFRPLSTTLAWFNNYYPFRF